MLGLGSLTSRVPSMVLADRVGCRRVATAAMLVYATACITAAGFLEPSVAADENDNDEQQRSKRGETQAASA